MKKINSNIKAFTLVELLVVLIISSLVITFTLTIFQQINLYFIEIQNKNSKNFEILNFYSHLYYDIENSNEIYYENSVLICYDLLQNKIEYDFTENDFVIKYRNNFIDTFKVKIEYVEYEFISEKLINKFEVKTEVLNDIDLKFYKNYTSDILYNIENKKNGN